MAVTNPKASGETAMMKVATKKRIDDVPIEIQAFGRRSQHKGGVYVY